MQRAALQARLQQEQPRERARGSLSDAAAVDAQLPPLSAESRAQLVRCLYLETDLPGKPAGSAVKTDMPVSEMEAQLTAAMPADGAAARQLAIERGRAVRQASVAKGLSADRLFLSEPDSKVAKANEQPARPMAQLTLSSL